MRPAWCGVGGWEPCVRGDEAFAMRVDRGGDASVGIPHPKPLPRKTSSVVGGLKSSRSCFAAVSCMPPCTTRRGVGGLVSVPSEEHLGVLWEVETPNRLFIGALRFTVLPKSLRSPGRP